MSVEHDRSGFPLIRVDGVGLWVHWLPVTKIQFEHYLCETEDDRFDQRWYEEITGLNPRISPHQVTAGNYWRSFLTGIVPDEIDGFARWCGDSFRLPTEDEWPRIYRELRDLPALASEMLPKPAGEGEGDRRLTLLQKLDEAAAAAAAALGSQPTRASQMLLRLGVMEWATAKGRQSWAGFGETNPAFHGMLRNPDVAARPNRATTLRIPYYGLRLVREA